MAPKSRGSRLGLGEPLASELAAFCEAHYGASEIRIVREALTEFMHRRLMAEPEMRRRYDAAREAQRTPFPNVILIRNDEG